MSNDRLSRGKIVAKAIELADKDGIDAVTLTRISQEFGVSQPALYRHVEGIDDLWKALAIRARDFLVERLSTAAIGQSGDDAVRSVAAAWRRTVLEHPGLLAVPDRIKTARDPELAASVDRIVAVLGLSLSSFQLDEENTVHAARSLRSALHGFTSFESVSGHPAGADIDESFERLVTLLCAGIREMANTQLSTGSSTAKPDAGRQPESESLPANNAPVAKVSAKKTSGKGAAAKKAAGKKAPANRRASART